MILETADLTGGVPINCITDVMYQNNIIGDFNNCRYITTGTALKMKSNLLVLHLTEASS